MQSNALVSQHLVLGALILRRACVCEHSGRFCTLGRSSEESLVVKRCSSTLRGASKKRKGCGSSPHNPFNIRRAH
jgi:hypothetical protein